MKDVHERLHEILLIVHRIWFAFANGPPSLLLDDYEVGFYVRHRGSRKDIYRFALTVRGGVDPATGRDVYSTPELDDDDQHEKGAVA